MDGQSDGKNRAAGGEGGDNSLPSLYPFCSINMGLGNLYVETLAVYSVS